MTSAALSTGSAKAHKLWGGRFSTGPAPEFDALNNSIGVDFRLWPYDIQASKAWAVALWSASVLTLEESKTIELGLDAVAERGINDAAENVAGARVTGKPLKRGGRLTGRRFLFERCCLCRRQPPPKRAWRA